jgi:hypothetical protein
MDQIVKYKIVKYCYVELKMNNTKKTIAEKKNKMNEKLIFR